MRRSYGGKPSTVARKCKMVHLDALYVWRYTTAMPKRPVSVRLEEDAITALKRVAASLGISQAAAFALAIRVFEQVLGMGKDAAAKERREHDAEQDKPADADDQPDPDE